MRLYYYPHAPYSRKALLAAYEKGVDLDRVLCAPFIPEQRAALEAVHPLATVPLLVHDELIVTESSLIVEHFDLANERAPILVPRDVRAAFRVRAMDRFGDTYLMAPTAYLAWSLRKPGGVRNEEKLSAQRTVLETALGLLDAELAGRMFLAGDDVSMADLSPVCALASALFDGTLDDLVRWPAVTSWYARLTSRPSFLRILEECRDVPLPPGF